MTSDRTFDSDRTDDRSSYVRTGADGEHGTADQYWTAMARTADLVRKLTALADRYEAAAREDGGMAEDCRRRVELLRAVAASGRRLLQPPAVPGPPEQPGGRPWPTVRLVRPFSADAALGTGSGPQSSSTQRSVGRRPRGVVRALRPVAETPTAAELRIAALVGELAGPLRTSLRVLSATSSVLTAHRTALPPEAEQALGRLCAEVTWQQSAWAQLLAALDREEQRPPAPPTTPRRADVVVVRPPTEIDLSTQDVFTQDMAAACRSEADCVVVDCSAVTFCSVAALDTLVSAATSLQAAGRALEVRDPPAMLVRMSRLTKVDHLLGLTG